MSNNNYLELYKKYRPRTWDEVIGQENVVNSMKYAVIHNEIPTGYLLSGPAGTGKALHKNTLIPTMNGFVKMDNIKIGDKILSTNGLECNVIGKYCPRDKKMFEITFDNKEKIKTSAGHLWTVFIDNIEYTCTTEDLYRQFNKNSFKESRLPYIKASKPIQYKEQRLTIHPYVLGVWLSDGTKNKSYFTKNNEDAQFINLKINSLDNYNSVLVYQEKKVVKKKINKYRIITNDEIFTKKLRDINVFNNKHIPSNYIYNTEENRRELLRGLFDTDGCTYKNGTIKFSQAEHNKQIVDAVAVILSSLGYRFNRRVDLSSKTPVYIIEFRPNKNDLFFYVERKQKRIRKNKDVEQVFKIKKIKQIKDNPENYYCIEVDSHDKLFLCGTTFIPTHNTTIAKIFAKAINCKHTDENGNPCNECDICRGIDSDSLLGVKYISMANHGSVDDVRAIIQASRLAMPIKNPVWILDEGQNLSSAAQDAFLIGLEDEKQKNVFIFCTTDPQKIKPAILSRLQQRNLKPVDYKTLGRHIVNIAKKEHLYPDKLTNDDLISIVENANGSVRNAISNLQTLSSNGELPMIFVDDILEKIAKADTIGTYTIVEKMSNSSQSFTKNMEKIYDSFFKMFKYKSGIKLDETDRKLMSLANSFSLSFLNKAIEITGDSLMAINRKTIDDKILFQMLLFKLSTLQNKSIGG